MRLFSHILIVVSLVQSVISSTIPSEWQKRIDSFNAFYAEDDTGKLNSEGYPEGLYLVKIIQFVVSLSFNLFCHSLF
jgi:hypothetical protein